LGDDSGDSPDGESQADPLLVPVVSGEIDGEKGTDAGLNVGEEKVQPIEGAETLG